MNSIDPLVSFHSQISPLVPVCLQFILIGYLFPIILWTARLSLLLFLQQRPIALSSGNLIRKFVESSKDKFSVKTNDAQLRIDATFQCTKPDQLFQSEIG